MTNFTFRAGTFKPHRELAAWFKKADPKAAKPTDSHSPSKVKSDITEVHLTALAALGLSVFIGLTQWAKGKETDFKISSLKANIRDNYQSVTGLRNHVEQLVERDSQTLSLLKEFGEEIDNIKANGTAGDPGTQKLVLNMFEEIRNRLQRLNNPELNSLTQQAPNIGSAIRRGLPQLFGDKTGFYDAVNPERWM